MTHASLSTIAQLVCAPDAPVNFARLVGDLDAVLSRFGDARRLLSWDCEDVAIFDMPGTRIALGWTDDTGQGSGCLTVAVGPSPVAAVSGAVDGNDGLCVRLVERVQTRLDPRAVLWHQIAGVVTAETIDQLVEALPRIDAFAAGLHQASEAEEVAAAAAPAQGVTASAAAPGVEPPPEGSLAAGSAAPRAAGKSKRLPNLRRSAQPQSDARVAAKAAPRRTPDPGATPLHATANDRPDLPRWHDPELGRLRAALYEPAEAAPAPAESVGTPSSQMRLAVHAMNATLIVVYAPLGAAVMTYALLKGEDMKLSSRLMMLTGSFALMAQTPLGHTMAALAGV